MRRTGPVDHAKLMEAVHSTLREVSTDPLETSTNTQSENQTIFDGKLAFWKGITFDENMTDDEVWKRICLIPYFGGVEPIPDERIARTLEVLGNYREVGQPGWLESGNGAEYLRESKEYKLTHSPNAAYWNSLKSKGPTIIRAAANLLLRQQQRGLSLMDILVPKHLREFRDQDLKDIFENFDSELDFGFITTFHAMMDLGLPVVKPDRMLVRTIVRLGVITDYGDPSSRSGRIPLTNLKITTDQAVTLGRKPPFAWEVQSVMKAIARSTRRTMREVDWLFAKMGMTETLEEGREFVVCDDVPKCGQCLARPMCAYAAAYYKPPVFKKSKKGGRRIRSFPTEPIAVAAE